MRMAVIGAGVSGNVAARLLSSRHEVHLFEAQDSAGGHAQTVVCRAFGKPYHVDIGFMVFNERNYPNFCRILRHLGIRVRRSDMSFSVRCARTGLEYQGSSFNGLFAQRRNLLRPRFHRMLRDIVRFNRGATQLMRTGKISPTHTVADLVREIGLGVDFLEYYLVPMAASIWSARPEGILDFPARFLARFFHNHGLLQLRDRPEWKTICGASRRYVDALLAPLSDRVHLSSPVASITRNHDGIILRTSAGQTESFDHVVCATHADQALRMLRDASTPEVDALTRLTYQKNEAVLHTDRRFLPACRRAWASWNAYIPDDAGRRVSVTYDLTRLQGIDAPSPILLTLNPAMEVSRRRELGRFCYTHPEFTVDSVRAQRQLARLNGERRTYFCGAYCGYGFHEDGVNSALAVAQHFGISLDECIAASTKVLSDTGASVR